MLELVRGVALCLSLVADTRGSYGGRSTPLTGRRNCATAVRRVKAGAAAARETTLMATAAAITGCGSCRPSSDLPVLSVPVFLGPCSTNHTNLGGSTLFACAVPSPTLSPEK